MAVRRTGRSQGVRPWAGREEKVFQGWPGRIHEPSPFADWNQNGCFHTALGHDLWTLFEARFKQLAKAGLGVLDLPLLFHGILREFDNN